MAAPAAVARQAPAASAVALKEGTGTKITLGNDPAIAFWETSQKPPGIDGGDGIQTTNMFNVFWETQLPRTLKKATAISGKCQYDPGALPAIINQINRNQAITNTFHEGTTWAWFGWLRQFEPDEIEPGKQPTASYTLEVSNWDPVNNVEAGPVIVSAAGS